MEGVTTITSQLHGVSVLDIHKTHAHISKYLSCNFETLGKNIPGDRKVKSIIFILLEDMTLWKVFPL